MKELLLTFVILTHYFAMCLFALKITRHQKEENEEKNNDRAFNAPLIISPLMFPWTNLKAHWNNKIAAALIFP